MARGDNAKILIVDKLKQAFGEDFAGYQDKKVYLWGNDGNERVQIALSMTCPKDFIGDVPATSDGGMNFEAMDNKVSNSKPIEITSEEMKNIEELMRKLGL